jgi:hypothetical protein
VKRRDAAILAAVVAVAGLAAVDAVFPESDAEPTQEPTGTVGAWSPDGDRIATSDGARIRFAEVAGSNRVNELRVEALVLDLGWLG